jgi:hypothetical protein
MSTSPEPRDDQRPESVRIRLFFIALGVAIPLLTAAAVLPSGLPRTIGIVVAAAVTGLIMWRYGYRSGGD